MLNVKIGVPGEGRVLCLYMANLGLSRMGILPFLGVMGSKEVKDEIIQRLRRL
jgi:hypothetical protein